MPRLAHRTSCLLAALALTPALATGASAAPATPKFPSAIEDLAPYDPQTTCRDIAQPGALGLRKLLLSAYQGTGDLGIVRSCAIPGVSEHKEGRAFDWAVNAYSATQDAQARDMLSWLLATDSRGNDHAIARRLGVMYVIYNRHIWSAGQASAGWRPYAGASPHTDHVHISLSRPGGAKNTSFWGATPVGVSPTSSPVKAKWTQLGGSSGVLGSPVGGEYTVKGGKAQDYAGGRIYYSESTGAAAVYGAILGRYDKLRGPGGPLGLPVADEGSVVGVSRARASLFVGGRIYWSPTTGVGSVTGAIALRHRELGGGAGALGLPLDDEATAGSGRLSTFQRGRLVWGPNTGAHKVAGAIGVGWDRAGGAAGPLGLPTSDEVDVAANGRANTFQGGNVYWSATTGVASVQGPIVKRFLQLGGVKALGLPVSDTVAVPGGLMSRFQRARILWGPQTGAHAVVGAIGAVYDAMGGPAGPLGLPTSEEVAAGRTGRASSFQGGRLIWSPRTGVQRVAGPVLAHLDAQGGVSGFLGFPVSAQTRVTATAQQQVFQGGRVYLAGGRVQSVRGAILAIYLQLGGPAGSLGAPVSNEYAVPGGRRSDFERGSLLFNGTTGAITRR